MLSKNETKFICNLRQKKFRLKNKMFLVENDKVIKPFLEQGYKPVFLIASKSFKSAEQFDNFELKIVKDYQFLKISNLKSPQGILAVFPKPKTSFNYKIDNLVVALDKINDPGNMGTIIRICYWFGINEIICSMNSTDIFSPKCIQSSAGAIAFVNINYFNFEELFAKITVPIIGTKLKGQSIYNTNIPKKAIIVFGSEAHGISNKVSQLLTSFIKIPFFGKNSSIDSLNISAALGVVLSEVKRNH